MADETHPAVAVVGAGVAGLCCAQTLAAAGARVAVFDKGRRVGGRLATRRQSGRQFDHGAPFFAAQHEAFRAALARWEAAGVVARFRAAEASNPRFRAAETSNPRFRAAEASNPRFRAAEASNPRFRAAEEHGEACWVGVGANRALAEHLAEGLDVHLQTRVAPLPAPSAAPRAVRLCDDAGRALGAFDRVVVTAPLAQASALLAGYPRLRRELAHGRHHPCWTLMADFRSRLPLAAPVWRPSGGSLACCGLESSKLGRRAGERWVVHASPAFTQAHLELEPAAAEARLLDALQAELGPLPEVSFSTAHRWRYAQVETSVGVRCVAEGAVVVAGDGLAPPGAVHRGVEAAWLSGRAAAERVRHPHVAPHRV